MVRIVVEREGNLFEVDNWGQVLGIISFVVQSSYRGHLLCPCGSGKKHKKCCGR